MIDAVINTSGGPHADVPFLAVATSAVAAVTVAGVVGRTTSPWWRQVLILIPVVVVGASLAASTSGVLTSGSGSWWRMASQPWSVTGHTAATVAGTAWFVAALTWTRGTWLGTVSPSFRATVWSLSLGAAAFIGMFLGRADRHAAAFRATTAGAGWLLFLWFPLSVTVVALVRERDLERQALSARLIPALGPVADHPEPADAGCGPDCAGRRRRDRPGRPDCGPCRGRRGHGGLGCGRDCRKVAVGPDP